MRIMQPTSNKIQMNKFLDHFLMYSVQVFKFPLVEMCLIRVETDVCVLLLKVGILRFFLKVNTRV